MKVLLIQPPYTIFRTEEKKCHPPLGLAYLAAAIKNKHDIVILDALAEGYSQEYHFEKQFLRYGLPFEEIKKRIEEIKPDVVGVSCLFSTQSENAHKVCAIVKEIDKKIITVMGGAHPSAIPEEVLADNNVDFVIIGEGEDTLNKLLTNLEYNGNIQAQDLDGIAFRYNDGFKVNRKSYFKEDLDGASLPYWEIFPLEKYFTINNPHGGVVKNTPFLPVITSRGCPFECIFCSIHNVWGRNYRKRSAENVLLELDYLTKKFGIKEILFEDDNLTLDKERAKAIFKGMADKNFNLSWSVPNGIAVQTLDEEMLVLMKNSGCYRISLGIESGDEFVLKKIIKKPTIPKIITPIINKAKELGLETIAFFVIGFPGETPTHIKNTFYYAERLGVDIVNLFFAIPLPGTRLLEICREKELIKGKLNYNRLRSDQPYFETEDLSRDYLISIVYREKIKLYFLSLLLNPRKFLSKLWNKLITNPAYFSRFMLKYIGNHA